MYTIDQDGVISECWLSDELYEIYKNEEWSKPYTDVDEMFRDLGLDDDDTDK